MFFSLPLVLKSNSTLVHLVGLHTELPTEAFRVVWRSDSAAVAVLKTTDICREYKGSHYTEALCCQPKSLKFSFLQQKICCGSSFGRPG